jgi:hypothetical protein
VAAGAEIFGLYSHQRQRRKVMLIYVYLLVRPVALFILLILGAFLAMRAGYPRLSLAVAVLLLIYGISTEALNKSAHSFGKPAPQGVRLLLYVNTHHKTSRRSSRPDRMLARCSLGQG